MSDNFRYTLIAEQINRPGDFHKDSKISIVCTPMDLKDLLSNLASLVNAAGYNYVEELHAVCGELTHTSLGETFDSDDEDYSLDEHDDTESEDEKPVQDEPEIKPEETK